MKYELNKPYEFEVKNVVNDNDILSFEVEIGGYLFPVKAYPEQLEEGTPAFVSCRIMRDKNKDAYLDQNEAYLYPVIYKSNRRYLFEVVDIKETYIILQDKYGLVHEMVKDGSKLSLNEVIVRNVEVINDSNGKAHLDFKYVEKTEEVVEIIHKVSAKSIAQLYYPPTIFEEDSPETIIAGANKSEQPKSEAETPKVVQSPKVGSLSLSELIMAKDWNRIREYLNRNLSGRQIPSTLKDVVNTIELLSSASDYWDLVRFLMDYDAHVFLASVIKADISNIRNIETVDDFILSSIVTKAFEATDKIKNAIELIKPCSRNLTTRQKNEILDKSQAISTPDAFFDIFKMFNIRPDDAVSYLLSLSNNASAAYALYDFYKKGKLGNRLSEKSPIEVFRPSKIAFFAKVLCDSKHYAIKCVGLLITGEILNTEKAPRDLIKAVDEKGWSGFNQYSNVKIQKIKANDILSSLTKGDYLQGLNFLRELDNYYLLIDTQSGAFALLVKTLTIQEPRKEEKSKGVIAKVMKCNGKTVFVLAQKKIPSMFDFPPLVNSNSTLQIGFSESNDGRYFPEVKNYTKLLNVEIDSHPKYIDYKARHQAKIVRKTDFFTYRIRII